MSMTIVWSAITKIVLFGLDADTMVEVDESPLIAIYGFNVIVSSMYIPGYTLTVYVLFAAAPVMLSTADLIELNCVLLPGNPTVTKLSMNVGGVYEAVCAYEADVITPVNDPLNDPVLSFNTTIADPLLV
jgi:hypothetical protein